MNSQQILQLFIHSTEKQWVGMLMILPFEEDRMPGKLSGKYLPTLPDEFFNPEMVTQ